MKHPLVYELNTRCWLRDLATRLGEPIQLGNVPEGEFQTWKRQGFSHIWLMGVWTVGPLSRAVSLASEHLRATCTVTLGAFKEEEVAGSPYAIADYTVAAQLGGESGLRRFRRRLRNAGLKLILDFVPNHVGLDHPWVRDHPEWFVHRLTPTPETFRQPGRIGELWLAHGKDPNFPAWTDTVQLDYRRPDTRRAVIAALQRVARLCDGVRCDMAMLLLNDVFVQTWQSFPATEPPSATEFWSAAIGAVKGKWPELLFLAEAYWDLEPRLLALGFDYVYDKRLYDCLVGREPQAVSRHVLGSSPEFVRASAHFLENHDELRIATRLSAAEHQAAALLVLGLPGMRLLHEGQLTGARTHTPVQLNRRRLEPPQPDITAMYEQILQALAVSTVGRGAGKILAPRAAWPDNLTWRNFVVVEWLHEGPAFDLVVVNWGDVRSQCYVPLNGTCLAQFNWRMTDVLGAERYERYGDDLQTQGLYLDVPPRAAQLFHFQPA